MSKKLFTFALITIVTMSTLTACGDAAATTSTPAAETIESEGEGPVQGGIKSDEEIAALQAEEAQHADEAPAADETQRADEAPAEETTTEYAENIDNTGHEPEAYGSGNFQDYWQGEDYFDLVSYLKDNGAVDAFPSNDRYEKVEDIAYIYVAYTSDYTWRLDIYINGNGSGAILTWMNHMQPPYDQEGPSYFVAIRDPNRAAQGNYRNVTVDEYGNTITDYDLEVISTIIQATQVDQGKDPLANYDNIGYFK